MGGVGCGKCVGADRQAWDVLQGFEHEQVQQAIQALPVVSGRAGVGCWGVWRCFRQAWGAVQGFRQVQQALRALPLVSGGKWVVCGFGKVW